MGQQLRFDILAEVVGQEKVDEFKRRLKEVGETSIESKTKLVDFAAGTYLLQKGFELANKAVGSFADIIKFGDELEAMSERTGISAQALSGYKAAADQANLSFEGLEKSLKKFTQNLGDVNNEKTKNALVSLGISAIDPTTKKLKDANVILDQVADKFANMENGPKKAALAFELFGKSGAEMIPFLNQGSEALHKFGLKFSDSFTANADAFEDRLSIFKTAIKQNMVDVVDGALPKLIALENALTELVTRDQSGNNQFGDMIASGLARATDWMHQLYLSFQDFGDYVSTWFERIGGWLKGMAREIGNFFSGIGRSMVDAINENYSQAWQRLKGIGSEASAISQAWRENDDRLEQGFVKRSADRQKSLEAYSKSIDDIISGKSVSNAPKKKQTGDAPDLIDDKYKKEHEAVQKFLITQREQIELERLKLQSYSMSAAELQKLTIAEQVRAQAEKESIGWTAKAKAEMRAATEEIIAQKQALIDLQEEQKRSFVVGAQTAMRDYMERLRDVATQSKEMFARAFQGMEDALVKFVKSGKLSFADLANAIIDDLVRIAVRQAELGIVLAVGSAFAPSPAPAASAGQSYSNISTSTAANGNVITRDGVMPLERFAKGGVVDRAHVAIFGEAGAEAFVPLPDGRSIPVSMKGASGGGNVSVIVNVNMADGTEKTAGSNDGQMLGKAIAAAVKAELINQKRPGGLLA
jgi:lambda family phage tail tape measure protein